MKFDNNFQNSGNKMSENLYILTIFEQAFIRYLT